MKVPKQVSLKKASVIILSMLLGFSFVLYVLAQTPTATYYIGPGMYPGGPAYTMWREGSNYFAKDENGYLEFSGTNASDIIIDCMDQLSGTGTEGGVIYFGINQAASGAIFVFTHGFTVPTKVSLIGQGYGRAPRLSFEQSDSSDCITVLGSAGGAYTRIENLRITGIAGTTGSGLVVTTGVHTVTLKDVQSDNHGTHGFLFNGSYNIKAYGIGASNNGVDGIYLINATSTVGELYFWGTHSKDNTQDGFEIGSANCSNIVFVGGTFETNGRYGGFARGAPINLYGVKFEANTDEGLMWTADGVISGCYFQGAPTNDYGLYFSTGGNTAVLGSRFASNWKDVNIDSASHNIFFAGALNLDDIDIHASSENVTFASVNPYGAFAYWNGTHIEELTLP